MKKIKFKERPDTAISLLSVLYVTSLLANLAVGYRYISLGSFTQSGGIFIFPVSFIISDIITEIYGSDLARKLVRYGIVCQFIFAVYAYLVIHTPAPYFLQNKELYASVFSPYLNFALASSISIWIGSKINIVLLSKFSEFSGGKYFAVRSFLASTAGEFLVTSISMVIANYSKLSLDNLIYMIGCCFIIKTIISFVAIWPASVIVYNLTHKRSSYKTILEFKRPIRLLKNLLLLAWNAKGFMYVLEEIDMDRNKAILYYKGTRGIIEISLFHAFYNKEIIDKLNPDDAASIGYYYAQIHGGDNVFLLSENKEKKNFVLMFKSGELNILGITRDKKIIIEDTKNAIEFLKFPMEIYRNKLMLGKFSSSQALYIGYLSGTPELNLKNFKPKQICYLKLVK
ncbi:phosphomannose isomerase GDP mannose pyrophosphorylase [Legionella rubrilucens]|uniref:Queuosine precursor transporter n=1 Tax=Legionella rubrilucens TaxID=458 RepID=A0A0W0XW04_9GAMM|nr:queuosine precursor transporter [Legionella rubrilucens]KTD48655.1 phosphomannose isomerase GDP mannose pyrophosphorylase [Legionella rubrilucens]